MTDVDPAPDLPLPAGPFAEPRRLDVRGIAVEAIGTIRQSAGTYGLAAVFALISGRTAVVLAIAAAILAVIGVVSLIGWMRRTYCLRNGELVVSSGVLQRRTTTVPLERVQGVSIDQQVAQRLLGVVRVRIDTAGTGGDEVDLSAVSRADAEALRAAILAGRSDAVPTSDSEPDDAAGPAGAVVVERAAPERTILHRSVNELLVVGLTRNPLRVVAAALGSFFAFGEDVLSQTDVDEQASDLLPAGFGGVMLAIALVAGLLVVLSAVAAVVRWYDLTLGVSGPTEAPAYAVRYGLLDRRERSVADRRVQVVTAVASVAERLVGRQTIRLAPAGAQGEGSNDGSAVTLPGSTAADVDAVIGTHLAGPRPGADRPIDRAMVLRRTMWIGGLYGALCLVATVVAAFNDITVWWLGLPAAGAVVVGVWWHARALWRSWFWGHDGSVLVTTHGVVGSRLAVAQIHKLQAVELQQGIFERRRRLASVSMRTAAGTIDVPYLGLDTARRLRDELLAVTEGSTEPWM